MIINNNWIYIHLHKTGGTWLERGISQSPKHRPLVHLPTHAPLGVIPEQFEHLPAWCVVRNPWDWYVSCWRFSLDHIRANSSIFGVPSGQFTQSHHDAMRINRSLRARIEEGHSFDYEFRSLTEHPRMEVTAYRLEDGLESILKKYVPTANMHPRKVNTSHRDADYRTYYDDDLAELVAKKNARTIERFDYTF